jgi:hypothetical protein
MATDKAILKRRKAARLKRKLARRKRKNSTGIDATAQRVLGEPPPLPKRVTKASVTRAKKQMERARLRQAGDTGKRGRWSSE